MRHGKIVCRAVVLFGLMSPVLHAAAPPVETKPDECPGSGAWEFCAAEGERERQATAALHDWFTDWQTLEQQRQRDRRGASACFPVTPAQADFAPGMPREVTIVVRIQDKPNRDFWDSANGLLEFYRAEALPPPHTIVRDGRTTVEQELETIIGAMQRKLLELHDEWGFDVSVDPLTHDRAGVSIQYHPVIQEGWRFGMDPLESMFLNNIY
jgi:hypothetical protein